MLKQISKRELFRKPHLMRLAHGEILVVTHQGKPDVVISSAVRRHGKSAAAYRRDAREIFGAAAPTFNGPEFLRSLR